MLLEKLCIALTLTSLFFLKFDIYLLSEANLCALEVEVDWAPSAARWYLQFLPVDLSKLQSPWSFGFSL